jgi:transposase
VTFSSFIDGSDVFIGHLGLIAGAYDSLGICAVIDTLLPKDGAHHLSHGDVLKAMSLNGLGFVQRCLYLFPDFFTDIAVSRLFGANITPDHFNDDVLGRTLDAIASFGPTELYNLPSACLSADQCH